jgi:hypothetical protein
MSEVGCSSTGSSCIDTSVKEGELALAGKGVLAIWNGIAAEAEADFVAWHIREHIPERVAVPGFLRGRRYVSERGYPRYFNFYEVETPETLLSPNYLERLNAPTEWTRRVVRHFRDTSRTICRVAASLGLGDGAYIATLRLSPQDAPQPFAAAIAPWLTRIADPPAIVAVHLLEGQGGGGSGQAAEKQLRGQPDETVDWILLIEAADREALDVVLADVMPPPALQSLANGFDATRDCGIYRLQFALARHQIA